MRKERIKKTKTVCTYCGVGCSFDVWTKDREVLKVQPSHDSPLPIKLLHVLKVNSLGVTLTQTNV